MGIGDEQRSKQLKLAPKTLNKTRICLKLEENRQLLMAFGSAIERELEDTCKITTVPRS